MKNRAQALETKRGQGFVRGGWRPATDILAPKTAPQQSREEKQHNTEKQQQQTQLFTAAAALLQPARQPANTKISRSAAAPVKISTAGTCGHGNRLTSFPHEFPRVLRSPRPWPRHPSRPSPAPAAACPPGASSETWPPCQRSRCSSTRPREEEEENKQPVEIKKKAAEGEIKCTRRGAGGDGEREPGG